MRYSENIIHFVADKWLTPSIEDIEHIDRDAVSATYKISGPSQKRPTDWTVALKNSSFKESLSDFFVKSWKDDSLAPFFNGKVLITNSKDTCYKFEPQDDKVFCTEQENYCNHEEADSRMFYHVSLVAALCKVVMRANDTDVIPMGCKQFYDTSLKLWLEVGTQSKNTIRYISIDQVCEKFGSSLCNALPAFHVFTGCDYTASFKRKGKVALFKLLEKSIKAREVFTEMSTDISLKSSILERVEKYLRLLYGKKTYDSIYDVRLQMFLEKYKQFSKKRSENETVLKINILDGSSWSPCSRVLIEKIKRTMFVARRWRCSDMQFQSTSEPCEHG